MDLEFSSDSFLERGKEEYADMTLFREYVVSGASYYDTASFCRDLTYNVELFLLNL